MYLRICNAQRVTDEVFRSLGQWISAPNPALRKNTIQKDSLSQIAILYPKQIWFKTSCTQKIGLKKEQLKDQNTANQNIFLPAATSMATSSFAA